MTGITVASGNWGLEVGAGIIVRLGDWRLGVETDVKKAVARTTAATFTLLIKLAAAWQTVTAQQFFKPPSRFV